MNSIPWLLLTILLAATFSGCTDDEITDPYVPGATMTGMWDVFYPSSGRVRMSLEQEEDSLIGTIEFLGRTHMLRGTLSLSGDMSVSFEVSNSGYPVRRMFSGKVNGVRDYVSGTYSIEQWIASSWRVSRFEFYAIKMQL